MESSFGDLQLAVRDTASTLADQYLAPDAARLDRDECFPTDTLKTLGASGLLGVNIAKEFGGLEAGVVSYVLAVRELGRRCAATTVGMMVTNMVAEAIQAYGNDAQKAEFIPLLKQGAWPAFGFSLSEPGSGSDAASLKTVAVRDGDDYVINGVKAWVTSGGHAGVYLVMAATDPAARARGISAFLVTPEMDGFQATKPEEKMGLRGSATTQLVFDNCRVPASRRLGPEGIGFKIAMSSLDGGRVGVSAQACGVAESALDVGTAWLDANPDHPQWALHEDTIARSRAELDAAWLVCLKAARLKDANKPLTREAAASKLLCTETANKICARMLKIFGPDGGDERYLLERLARDVRVTRIYEGTSEIQRIVVAREVLKGAGTGGR
ncbi:MAG: acyl-CoA dehydrogenase family protein [Bradymonadia bacterium]